MSHWKSLRLIDAKPTVIPCDLSALCGEILSPVWLRRCRARFALRSLDLVLHFTADQSHLDLQFANLFGLYAERVFGQDRDIGEFADF